MNEQLEQAVVALINKAVETADTASDFIVGEAPVVVEQLLLWHGVSSILWCITGFLFSLVIFFVWKRSVDVIKEADDRFLYTLIMAAAGVSSSFILVDFEWLKILIAPKVWLIEYAAKIAG